MVVYSPTVAIGKCLRSPPEQYLVYDARPWFELGKESIGQRAVRYMPYIGNMENHGCNIWMYENTGTLDLHILTCDCGMQGEFHSISRINLWGFYSSGCKYAPPGIVINDSSSFHLSPKPKILIRGET